MDKDLTPLGELLEAARLAKRPKLSQNAVAKAAGTSSTTYRRIISGISRFGGQDVPFDGSADTVAQIARVLGVTPEQLEQAGRTDAAEELRILEEPPSRLQVVTGADAPADEPGDEGLDEKLDRAQRLMAEGMALLEELRRERRESG